MSNKKWSSIFFLLISLVLIRFAALQKKPLITSWDNLGYYLILPQTFIYNDPANKNVEQIDSLRAAYNLSPNLYQLHKHENGNSLSQYTVGMAIMHSPAFFAGHLIAKISGYNADGFSPPYQWGLLVLNLIYILISFYYLIKLLNRFFSEKIVLMLSFIVFFGTNYFVYATVGYGMPHTYLFLLYVLFIEYTVRWHENKNTKNSLMAALILGLMTITRPTEFMALIIPLMWGVTSVKELIEKIKMIFQSKKIQFLVCTCVFFAVLLLQLIYWKIYTGHWLYKSYQNPGEGFEFMHPHIYEFLFSYRKGWLLYTPVMIFAIIGIVQAIITRQKFGVMIFIFLVIYVFVHASWSSWWYAASLGQRTMIQTYPLLIFGLGFFTTQLRNSRLLIKYFTQTLMCALLIFNLFQCWQYYYGILPVDRITGKYYWAVFGKTNVPANAQQFLLVNRNIEMKAEFPEQSNYRMVKYFSRKNVIPKLINISGSSYELIFENLKLSYESITSADHLWVHVSFDFSIDSTNTSTLPSLVMAVQNKHGLGYGWRDLSFDKLPKSKFNQKNHVEFYYLTPPVRLKTDNFIFYVRAGDNNNFQMKNFKLEFLERSDNF